MPTTALPTDDTPRARRLAAAAVAGLCLASLLAKLAVNASRNGLNHGDVSFYYSVARNLAEGRGFVIDYIWNFWNHPQGLPTPSNVWWMPLPSVLCAAGMKLFGVTYAVAQDTMIALTSLVPWAVYLLGREVFGGRAVPLAGAALAAGFHLFLDQVCAPLSHGPYLLAVTLALWLIVRSTRDQRWLPAAGAAIALVQLSRSDGILLFATLVAAHLFARSRPRARAWLLVPLAYALVMAPWWAHNLSVHGALQPGGSFRAVYLRQYEQWYSLPESVTRESWLADGWGPVLDLKLTVAGKNAWSAATGMVSGAADRDGAWEHPELVAVMVLAWAGLVLTLARRGVRTRFAPVLVQAALEFGFYSFVFTAVGPESFRSGMYSVYPGLLLAAGAALDLAARGGAALLARAGRPGRPAAVAHGLLLAAALAWIGLGQVGFARASMERKGAGIDRLNAFYAKLAEKVFPRVLGPGSVLMARDVHELSALTRLPCVMIPFEPEPVIRQVAARYGVTHLMLLGDPASEPVREGLADIDRNPRWKRVAGPLWIEGIRVQVYELT